MHIIRWLLPQASEIDQSNRKSPSWAPGACGTCACGTWPQGQERPAQAAERGKKFHNVFSMGKHEVSEYVNGLGKVLNYGKLRKKQGVLHDFQPWDGMGVN